LDSRAIAENVSVVRAAEQPLVESGKSPLVSRTLLKRETFGGVATVSWIKLDGMHARQNSGPGERFYYILSGSVVFQVAHQPPERAEAGDVVYMPKNCYYTFEGRITYLYNNVPL
jgi:quercetin dioxygenase-like cupin family protein